MTDYVGKKILIVEDEVVIAILLEDMITELGAIPIGPAYNLHSGLALAGSAMIDGAILDVNLNNGDSSAIANALADRDIPFILATGYGSGAHNIHDVPVLQKPYQIFDIEAALCAMFGPSCH